MFIPPTHQSVTKCCPFTYLFSRLPLTVGSYKPLPALYYWVFQILTISPSRIKNVRFLTVVITDRRRLATWFYTTSRSLGMTTKNYLCLLVNWEAQKTGVYKYPDSQVPKSRFSAPHTPSVLNKTKNGRRFSFRLHLLKCHFYLHT